MIKIICILLSVSLSIFLSACSLSGQDKITTLVENDAQKAKVQPNILWIITDDQRPDSIAAYNRAVYKQSNSPVGYVESPNVDKLAEEGVLFTNAFTNSPVCGPSRGSMHSGRYPFRTSHHAFELTHQNPDFVKPTVSQTMRDHGYATSVFGKEDSYIYKWGPGQGFNDAKLYDYKVHFKHDLQANGLGDLFTKAYYDTIDGNLVTVGYTENVLYPNGNKKSYFLARKGAELTEADIASKQAMNEELGLLRSYTRGGNKDLILAGGNPKPAGETVDAYIVKEMKNYLANPNQEFSTGWGKTATGADTSKPQFIHLGFHLPHTPVIPPQEFRDRFKDKIYTLPKFDKEKEHSKLPAQLVKLYEAVKSDTFTEEEKQQAIRDYYAFCAYGDMLIGEAVEAFKQYNKAHNQEYLIIYTIGDHGWHLGEQGIMAKFGPWQQSVGNAAIVVSSDKSLVPANRINEDLVEFVDFAPTIMAAGNIDIEQEEFDYLDGLSLIDVIHKKVPQRDYILGEINVIVGPRAYMHTKRFRFSMRTRPFDTINLRQEHLGKDIKWGLDAPAKDVEMALYDFENDPLELNNLAYDKAHLGLSNWFRQKLGNIVLGDNRIEADWSQANSYFRSDFALGADDKMANIPENLIPQ